MTSQPSKNTIEDPIEEILKSNEEYLNDFNEKFDHNSKLRKLIFETNLEMATRIRFIED